MSDQATDTALVAALVAHGRLVTDMVWALQWLDSLTDDLNTERHERTGEEQHPRTSEFLADLDQRLIDNDTLKSCWKEAAQ